MRTFAASVGEALHKQVVRPEERQQQQQLNMQTYVGMRAVTEQLLDPKKIQPTLCWVGHLMERNG